MLDEDLSCCKDTHKVCDEVPRGEVEHQTKEDRDGEGRQCTTHNAQDQAGQAQTLHQNKGRHVDECMGMKLHTQH